MPEDVEEADDRQIARIAHQAHPLAGEARAADSEQLEGGIDPTQLARDLRRVKVARGFSRHDAELHLRLRS